MLTLKFVRITLCERWTSNVTWQLIIKSKTGEAVLDGVQTYTWQSASQAQLYNPCTN